MYNVVEGDSMNIAIVDDNENEIKELVQLLEDWCHTHFRHFHYDVYKNGNDFLTQFHCQYDIVFMDIYMEHINGIQTALKMREKSHDLLLIFITSSQEHFYDAYSCHPFDYILKPIDQEKFFKVFNEAVLVLSHKQSCIYLPIGKQVLPLLLSDIIYITSDANYCIVNTCHHQYRCRIPFSKVLNSLSLDDGFCKINRGIVINLDKVLHIENSVCEMKNGEKLPVNRRKQEHFKQVLIEYKFKKRQKRFKNERGGVNYERFYHFIIRIRCYFSCRFILRVTCSR